MSFLSRLSLANRSAVALAAVALILLGLLIIPSLKQELFPSSLASPVITIVSLYPGATPVQVEQDVTNPIEQNIQGQQGVQGTSSQSSEGVSIITVYYSVGNDLAIAQQKLEEGINRTRSILPSNVISQVQAFNINDLPVISLAVTSSQNLQDLGVALKQEVVPALQGINGVATVNITGVRQQVVSIILDPRKLQDNAVRVDQVQSALQANNITIPAGEVALNGHNLAIRAGNTLTSIQALQDLPVGTHQNAAQTPGLAANAVQPAAPPAVVKLGDVASIQEELVPSTTLTRVNGQPGLGISLTRTPAGNTVAISQALRARLPVLEQRLGHGTHITIIDDQAPLIQHTIGELTSEGLLGAGLAVLVILVFLLSIRSTLVTIISIPLSVLIALIALWVQGYSLNALTLSGLTVAVGRVVDDSIVVLENIYRHLQYGGDKRVAILTAVKEVAAAVTSSTLTTVAVFLPLALVGGNVGQQATPLALAVTIALLASLLVALTVIPVLAYWFLQAPRAAGERGENEERPNVLERGYIPLINWVTGHRIITIILAIMLLVGSFALFPLIPVNFSGSTLTLNSFSFTQQLPAGTTLEQTDQAAGRVEAVLASIHDIQVYQTTIGTSNAGSAASAGSNSATFIVTGGEHADIKAVERMASDRLHRLDNIGTITFQEQALDTVDVTVQASNEQVLRQAAGQVLQAMKTVPHASDVRSDLVTAQPLIAVSVDPARAFQHGLTALQAGQLLQMGYTGTTVTHLAVSNDGSAQEDVNLKLATTAATVQQIQDTLLPGPLGPVRLGDIAAVAQVSGPVKIAHVNSARSATITLVPADQDYYNDVLSTVQSRLARLKLPGDAKASPGTNATAAQDTIQELLLALALAIPTIFIVLVVTFRSIIQPLLLLVAIPFAAIGSIVLSALTRTPLGSSSLFGFLMLIGIVVTNAIVLIDRVNHYRAQGMDPRSAVIAGGRRRVRPILMTAVVTIIALIPLAISNLGNAVVSSSLAIVVIGGLATSTFLTLLLVPTLYVMIENARDRLRKHSSMVVSAANVQHLQR